MAETTHKYKIGQKVTFDVTITSIKVPCPDCKGRGGYMMHSVYDNGDWCSCDKCRGAKTVDEICPPHTETKGPFTISDILISGNGIYYSMDQGVFRDMFLNPKRIKESNLKLYKKPKVRAK